MNSVATSQEAIPSVENDLCSEEDRAFEFLDGGVGFDDGIPILPPLTLADFGRSPPHAPTITTVAFPDDDLPTQSAAVPGSAWPLVTTALALVIGTCVGTWLGVVLAGMK